MNWALIPHVFYDLIARVVPGSITLLGVYSVVAGPAKAARSALNGAPEGSGVRFSSLLVWLLLSYVVGRMLAEISVAASPILKELGKKGSRAMGRIRKRWHKKTNKTKKNGCKAEYDVLAAFLGEGQTRPAWAGKAWPKRHVLHDHLRLYAPSQAVRILKLHAEWRMLNSLVVGLIAVLLVNLVYCVSQHVWPWDRVILLMGLPVCTVLCWLGADRSSRYYTIATQRAWLFYNFPLGAAKYFRQSTTSKECQEVDERKTSKEDG
jgi:hypothetical protein